MPAHPAALLALCGLLAACAGTPPPATLATPFTGPNPDFGIEIGGLPAQKLAGGACGLFLWSKAPHRQLVFFAESGTSAPVARMMLDGRQSALTRTAADGNIGDAATVRQSFDAGGRRVDLEFRAEPRRGLVDGAAVPRGMLRIEDGSGREIVLPVGGLIACAAG